MFASSEADRVWAGAGAGEDAADVEGRDAKVREAVMAAVLSGPWLVVDKFAACEPERGIEGEATVALIEARMGLPVSLSRAGELVLRGMLKESRSRVEGR